MSPDTPRADRVTSVILAILGLAMLIGGYQMDRLEIRNIHPASIPGLVPMILGALMVVCAVLLFNFSRKVSRLSSEESMPENDNSSRKLLITAGICTFFATVMVGRMPFFVSSAIFISVFSGFFSWPSGAGYHRQIKVVVYSICIGGVAAAIISVLFQYGFLVRLP